MFDVIKEKAVGFVSNVGFKAAEKKPEIFLALGLVTGAAGLVMACKATLKAPDILKEHEESMKMIEDAEEQAKIEKEKDPSTDIIYTEKDKRNDTVIAYGQTAWKTIKLYAPAAALCVVSTACFIAMYKEQHNRIVGLTAAYTALQETFRAVEKRVTEEEGADKWNHYRFGTKAEEMKVSEMGEDGLMREKTAQIDAVDPKTLGDFIFSDATTNGEFTGIDYQDETYLVEHEALLNYRFQRDKHLLANEMCEELGIKLSVEQKLRNANIGWVLDLNNPLAANKIKLRWTKKYIPDYRHKGCWNAVYILDPNFDGVIRC